MTKKDTKSTINKNHDVAFRFGSIMLGKEPPKLAFQRFSLKPDEKDKRK